APRDFTAKWLAKRLADYGRGDPEIRFTLVASEGDLDFTEANLDLAIRLAEGPGENEGVKLADGAFVTIAAADGAADTRIAWPGCPSDEDSPALRVADAGLAIDAAVNGFGRTSVPELLAVADIAAGRVKAVGDARQSPLAYWLIAPLPQWRQKKVKALVEALTG
ncbi:MAG: LysR family transcriptional regulator, partial [Sphingomonadaceae bacterium]